jgi:hypothetical protein
MAIAPQNAVNSRKSETPAGFGLGFALPGSLADLYKSLNGDASWTLPRQARFVLRTQAARAA